MRSDDFFSGEYVPVDLAVAVTHGTRKERNLWLNAYAKLPSRGKKILNALKEDWRIRPAARIASASQPMVDRWKTFFKVHFNQCHQAYRRNFPL